MEITWVTVIPGMVVYVALIVAVSYLAGFDSESFGLSTLAVTAVVAVAALAIGLSISKTVGTYLALIMGATWVTVVACFFLLVLAACFSKVYEKIMERKAWRRNRRDH